MLIIEPWLIEIDKDIHDLAKYSLGTLSCYISGKLRICLNFFIGLALKRCLG